MNGIKYFSSLIERVGIVLFIAALIPNNYFLNNEIGFKVLTIGLFVFVLAGALKDAQEK